MHHLFTAPGLNRRGFRFKSFVTLAALFVAALSLSACSSGGGSALGGSQNASLVSLCVSGNLSGNVSEGQTQAQQTTECRCEVSFMLSHGVSSSQADAYLKGGNTTTLGVSAVGQAMDACFITPSTPPTTIATTVPSTAPTTTPTTAPSTIPTTTPTSTPSTSSATTAPCVSGPGVECTSPTTVP